MSPPDETPLPAASSLRQILGALVFAADHALSVEELRTCLRQVAEEEGGEAAALFAGASARDVRDALADIGKDLARLELGLELSEIDNGFRFQTQPACGAWVRRLLKQERPNRLSRPSLETLAIVAYRQPIAKSEIEGIRGVAVDHILKTLMELHLVRIVGRSDLPGRPFLYGTTSSFLAHFGLKNLDELNDMDPTLQRSRPRERAALHRKPKPPAAPAGDEAAAEASDGTSGAPPPPDAVDAVLGLETSTPPPESAVEPAEPPPSTAGTPPLPPG